MTEIWKDIKGYEGLYQVSNLGRCRSLDKDIPCSSLFSDKKSLVRKGKILSDKRLSHVGGYIKHRLTKDKKTKIMSNLDVVDQNAPPPQQGLPRPHG